MSREVGRELYVTETEFLEGREKDTRRDAVVGTIAGVVSGLMALKSSEPGLIACLGTFSGASFAMATSSAVRSVGYSTRASLAKIATGETH